MSPATFAGLVWTTLLAWLIGLVFVTVQVLSRLYFRRRARKTVIFGICSCSYCNYLRTTRRQTGA